MPTNTESAVNVKLAQVLGEMHPAWRDGIGAEQSQVFSGAAARRPDLVVRQYGGQPVVVETEFLPAREVEGDACARLGQVVRGSDEVVEQTIAVRLPLELRSGESALRQRIADASFEYAVFAGTTEAPRRWPSKGWLGGDIYDLAACIEHASLSERRVAEGAEMLERAVRAAATKLEGLAAGSQADTLDRIAGVLHQAPGTQTTRMAMAIVANAMTFHSTIAGAHGIPLLRDLREKDFVGRDTLSLRKVDGCWRRILREINYWPIFHIAKEILRCIPGRMEDAVGLLEGPAEKLAKMGAAGTHDLSGQMFQRLIVDRKFLATFYTLPTSATLLAELAVSRMDARWTDKEVIANLRVADLACGTGTLLSAAYQSVRRRCRHHGGDDAQLHPVMMEKVLIAADIMPAATHLTASILSGAHPAVPFSDTRVRTMPYGEQPQESGHPLSIGSLDLLVIETARSLSGMGRHPDQTEAFGTGRETVVGTGESGRRLDQHQMDLRHESGDLLIMNPPFTRPTNHESATVPVPSFAGFNTSRAGQRAMSKLLDRTRKELRKPAGAIVAGHGNAGLASDFVDLAHQKTKLGGVVALVLPAVFVQGGAWSGARELFSSRYEDILVVSIVTSGSTDRAFSADTGMAEVLMVATKKTDPSAPGGDTLFVNLTRRPESLAEGAALAGVVQRLPQRPDGRIRLGDDDAGTFIRAPLEQGGCAAIREPALAVAMLSLPDGQLKLPRTTERHELPVTALGELGKRGRLDRDIAGKDRDGTPRGPFDILLPRGFSLYPILWSHDAKRERYLVVKPNREGGVREGLRKQADELWEETASRLHFNRDFQINSQSLTACITPEKSIGGRAWPNFVADREEWEEPLALWANSTLGLLCFWWIGTRQQQGRAVVTISRLPVLTVLDPRRLSVSQLDCARQVFERLTGREMLPANEAYRDEVRQELDRALLVEVLGLPETLLEPLAVLRNAWCAEPTVHGGKKTKPT